MDRRRNFLVMVVVMGLFLTIIGGSWAAEKKFPTKPIQVIIPMAPGDTDMVLRPVVEKMHEYLGQPLTIIYKPGASGSVGAGAVADSKPDGYILVGSTQTPIVITPITQDVGYTWKSFAPVCCLAEGQAAIVVQSSSPWKTLKDLIEDSKKSPGKFTAAGSGALGLATILSESLCMKAGIKWTYIPSQGSGPAITALLGGHVNLVTTALSTALPHLRAGTLRVLAIFGPKRMKAFPDVPTLSELGYDISTTLSYGLYAPKGTPKEVVDTLSMAAKKVLDNHGDAIAERLGNLGVDINFKGPEEYTAHLAREYESISETVRFIKSKGKN